MATTLTHNLSLLQSSTSNEASGLATSASAWNSAHALMLSALASCLLHYHSLPLQLSFYLSRWLHTHTHKCMCALVITRLSRSVIELVFFSSALPLYHCCFFLRFILVLGHTFFLVCSLSFALFSTCLPVTCALACQLCLFYCSVLS